MTIFFISWIISHINAVYFIYLFTTFQLAQSAAAVEYTDCFFAEGYDASLLLI